MNLLKFKINGMSCSHCKLRVEKALAATHGVQSFQVDLTQGLAEVRGDAAPTQIIAAINQLGYEAILLPAS